MDMDARRRVARALTHPTRITILMKMNDPRRRMSPKAFCDETDGHLSNVSYHFRCLKEAGLIKLVAMSPARGSVQHFYEPVERAMAWAREFAAMSPAMRQNLAATALRGGVEAVGRAVDAGSFDRRLDSHLSYQTMRVDELGWEELAKLFDRTLESAMAIAEESEARLPNPSGGFLASYLISAFEAAPPDDLAGLD